MPTLLITGSNRGLGLEFARQYAAEVRDGRFPEGKERPVAETVRSRRE